MAVNTTRTLFWLVTNNEVECVGINKYDQRANRTFRFHPQVLPSSVPAEYLNLPRFMA